MGDDELKRSRSRMFCLSCLEAVEFPVDASDFVAMLESISQEKCPKCGSKLYPVTDDDGGNTNP